MKERQSNIELLRIIAMFLVLLVHADFFSLGGVTSQDIRVAPLDSTLKVFFEAISINCVDIFVLISGWFGIRASFKGGCKFIFQCFFFLCMIYAVTLLLGISNVNIETIKYLFVATKWNWFIKAYLLLYILSPVLNAYVEQASKRQFAIILLLFYGFQFFYGWIFASSTGYIADGYSISSFIGLYLLARYVKLHDTYFKSLSVLSGLLICLGMCCMITVLYVAPSLFNVNITFMGGHFLSYISPTTIACSLLMIVAFSKMHIQSEFINYVARSSFAVFLLHTNPNILSYYKDLFVMIHNHLSVGTFWIVSFAVMVGIFAIGIILDQIRIQLWKKVSTLYDK